MGFQPNGLNAGAKVFAAKRLGVSFLGRKQVSQFAWNQRDLSRHHGERTRSAWIALLSSAQSQWYPGPRLVESVLTKNQYGQSNIGIERFLEHK